MNSRNFSSLLILLLLFAASCGGDSNGPSFIAQEFLTAVEAHDWGKAKSLASESTAKELDAFADGSGESQFRTIYIRGEKIDGDHATVDYTVGDDATEKTISLIRGDKNWLVETTKKELAGPGSTTGNSDGKAENAVDNALKGLGNENQEQMDDLERMIQEQKEKDESETGSEE